jgi:hypothetical protein
MMICETNKKIYGLLNFYNSCDSLSKKGLGVTKNIFTSITNQFQSTFKAPCNLKQVVKKATRGNNILDLIFTNIADFYQIPYNFSTFIHVWPLHSDMESQSLRDSRFETRGKQTCMSAFGSVLKNFDWHQILYGWKIDEKANRFITIVNSMVREIFSGKYN